MTRVEVQSRWCLPAGTMVPTDRRAPGHDRPRWFRHSEWLDFALPELGGTAVLYLPAPMFSLSAAHAARLELFWLDGQLSFNLDRYPRRLVTLHPWRLSALWSQVTFQPHDEPGPWWFRWRTPNASGLTTRLLEGLAEIDDNPHDPHMIRQTVTQLRREITLDALAAPIWRTHDQY